MKVFLCTFFLLVLLPKAISLKCALCFNDEKTCLKTRIQKCKSQEDTCISGVTGYTQDGKPEFSSFKSCMESKYCHANYSSVTVEEGKYSHTKATCCKKDLCNNVTVKLPPKNTVRNGLQCPSCFSINSDHCDAKKAVKCTHNENRCIYFVSTITVGGFQNTTALKGCATEASCATKPGVIVLDDGFYVNNITRLDCTPAAPSPTKG